MAYSINSYHFFEESNLYEAYTCIGGFILMKLVLNIIIVMVAFEKVNKVKKSIVVHDGIKE
jgi:hypothetical protein